MCILNGLYFVTVKGVTECEIRTDHHTVYLYRVMAPAICQPVAFEIRAQH